MPRARTRGGRLARQQSSSRSTPVRNLVRHLSLSGHRRAWAAKGARSSFVPEHAYRRRTRAPRRHPRALRCSLRRPPPRADSGGRWGTPFVVGFGSRELVFVPSSTGSETSMTSRYSTRGRADASRRRGARSLGFKVLSWVVRRPHGRVPLVLPRAPTANGACRRTLRGRTGAGAPPSPRPRPARRSHPLRVRRRAHPPRRAHAGNVDDAGAEVGRCRRPLVSGSWGRLARCRACWARSRRATGARGRPRSLRSRTGAPRSARRRGFQSAPLPPLRSCRAPVGPVRAEPRARFAPSPSRAAPSAFAVEPRASRASSRASAPSP